MKRWTYFAAAALAIGGLGLVGCNKDDTATTDNRTPGDKAADAARNTGNSATQAVTDVAKATTKGAENAKNAVVAAVTPSGSDKIEGTQGTVEGVVENVFKRNEYDAMADHFTKADADRVKNGKPDTKDLDDLGDQFTNAWNTKYNDKFTTIDAAKVYGTDFMKLASDTSGDAKNKRATGTIAASHGLPDLTLTFVDEGGKWRLDIPDTVDAQKLHDNLKAALTALQDPTQWPADKVDAYRAVSHRILAAVMDKAAAGAPAARAE